MEPEIKRLKRLFKDPNPLFRTWLNEWKEEAEKKDTKMKFVYRTALKSLQQYPLPLTSGKSCNILKGFGVMLCAQLDERLKHHIAEHGPLPVASVRDQVELGGARRAQKPTGKRAARSPLAAAEHVGSLPLAPQRPAGSPKTGRRKSAEYRPRPGSGAHAVLVTLRRHENQPGYAGFLHKAALQEAAQPLCSSSFTLPEPSSYYTAWRTVSGLVKRQLVLREGNPARFSLTPAGRDVADRLQASPAAGPSQRSAHDRLPGPAGGSPGRVGQGGPGPAHGRGTARSPAVGAGRAAAGRQSPPAAPPAAGPGPLAYQYVSDGGADVARKGQAAVLVDADFVGFLCRCRPAALAASGRRYRSGPTRANRDGTVHVFLADADCAEVCPAGRLVPDPVRRPHAMSDSEEEAPPAAGLSPSPKRARTRSPSPPPPDEPIVLSDDDSSQGSSPARLVPTGTATAAAAAAPATAGQPDLLTERLPRPTLCAVPLPAVSAERLARSVASAERDPRPTLSTENGPRPPPSTENGSRPSVSTDNAHWSSAPTDNAPWPSPSTENGFRLSPTNENAPRPSPSNENGSRPSPTNENAPRPSPSTENGSRPSLVLLPDTFDVVLCVDNQETSGKSGSGACLRTYRDVVLDELQKNGVVVDVRKLSVGDFLWVARPRIGLQPEELVLPYVVERKRLDDLASSIRDSRYREQKFRLKRCGLPHVIYLAEAMGTGPRASSVGLPESTLQQALANCQVVDGFRVKRTADQRETAAFLTLVTRRLQRQYRSRRLESCPRDQLPAHLPPAGAAERLQLFSEFHQLSAKRRRLTASDAFAKMLLQLAGLSADKAGAVMAAYPTVRRLLDAYGRCRSDAEAEALLAPLRAERSGRPLGATLSRTVYHLYRDRELV